MKGIDSSDIDRIAYEEVKGLAVQIEHHLSDYLDHEDILDLKRWCFEYAERKAFWLEFRKDDPRISYLQAYVQYELMTEIKEFLEEVPRNLSLNSSHVASDFMQHNDLDFILSIYEKRAVGHS
ncbi:MAG: hypothetical protein WCI72_02635 [archaeon]